MERTVQSTLSPEALSAFLREVTAAAKKIGIYPPGHPATVKAAEKPFALLRELLGSGRAVVFALSEGTLVGDGAPLDAKLMSEGLGKALIESGLSSISFEPGIASEEFELLLAQLNLKKEHRDLQKFVEQNQIRHMKFGKFQYQLVKDNERVISEDEMIFGGGTGGGMGDGSGLGTGSGGQYTLDSPEVAQQVERTMTDVLRKYPELLLQIVVRKLGVSGSGGGSGGGIGAGVGPGTGNGGGGQGSGTGNGSGSGGGGNGGGSGGGSGSGSGIGNCGGVGGGSGSGSEVEWRGDIAGAVRDGLRALGVSHAGTSESGSGAGSGSGSGKGSGAGSGTGVKFSPDDYKKLKDAFKQIDNEELLGLLISALKVSLGESRNVDRVEVGKTLVGFRELLAEREAIELLPRLKAEIESLDLLDNDYLREILSADATPKKVAHIEIENFKSDFFMGAVNPRNVDDVLGWLETISDKQYTEDFIKKFYDGMARQGYELTETQHEALLRFASLCAEDADAPVSRQQIHEIRDRLSDPAVDLKEFTLLAEMLEKYYIKYIELDLYNEATSLLDLVIQKQDSEVIYNEGVMEYAAKVYQRMSSAQLAEQLVAKLGRSLELVGKPMIPLLEKFNNLEPILVFASYLNHNDRGVRITLIRILSSFGEKTLNAFKLVLSDRTLTARPLGKSELPTETWFKLRNLIFVLGNILHPDSVDIVRKFAQDPDERVVMEALLALEKLGGPESAKVVAKLLQHPTHEIHVKALHALGQIGTAEEYPYVEDYFLHNVTDRQAILPVLIRLDKQRSLSFLAQVLLGESEIYNKLFAKADDELNETIVKTFILLRSVIFDDVLRKYVRNSTRSLFGQFRKSESVKMAERYLKTVSTDE